MRDGEVLLVIDVQNDFCLGGRLAQDWHADGRHLSFAPCCSAEDAAAHGFDTMVVEEACRANDLAGAAAPTKASFATEG
ncbi:MAG: hypothetical protein AB7F09_02385 [Parvibaculaceae bacterium]